MAINTRSTASLPLPMSKKSRSKLWFLVHSWLALPIWFFVLIVCVTGTLAVVSQEIVWLANPQMRAQSGFNNPNLVGAVYAHEPSGIVAIAIVADAPSGSNWDLFVTDIKHSAGVVLIGDEAK